MGRVVSFNPRIAYGAFCVLLLAGCGGRALAQHLASSRTANGLQENNQEMATELPDAPLPQSASQAVPGPPSIAGAPSDQLPLSQTPSRLLHDEWHILSSPVRVRLRDLRWLLPLAGATAASLATDTHTMRDVVSTNTSFNNSNDTTSTVLRDIFIGAPVALFGSGELAKDGHERDAGLLADQAMVNAYVTDFAIKLVFLRERPQTAKARGHFFEGDAASDPSFVSGHSIVAWSSAAALAQSYSRPWQQVGIYTMATGVSLTRVLAQQHFPTDVLLGSVSGWLIGHYVARAHRSYRLPKSHRASASLSNDAAKSR